MSKLSTPEIVEQDDFKSEIIEPIGKSYQEIMDELTQLYGPPGVINFPEPIIFLDENQTFKKILKGLKYASKVGSFVSSVASGVRMFLLLIGEDSQPTLQEILIEIRRVISEELQRLQLQNQMANLTSFVDRYNEIMTLSHQYENDTDNNPTQVTREREIQYLNSALTELNTQRTSLSGTLFNSFHHVEQVWIHTPWSNMPRKEQILNLETSIISYNILLMQTRIILNARLSKLYNDLGQVSNTGIANNNVITCARQFQYSCFNQPSYMAISRLQTKYREYIEQRTASGRYLTYPMVNNESQDSGPWGAHLKVDESSHVIFNSYFARDRYNGNVTIYWHNDWHNHPRSVSNTCLEQLRNYRDNYTMTDTVGQYQQGLNEAAPDIMVICNANATANPQVANRVACTHNQNMIKHAEQLWWDANAGEGYHHRFTWSDLVPHYISSEPQCPSHGTYELGWGLPRCSFHGAL